MSRKDRLAELPLAELERRAVNYSVLHSECFDTAVHELGADGPELRRKCLDAAASHLRGYALAANDERSAHELLIELVAAAFAPRHSDATDELERIRRIIITASLVCMEAEGIDEDEHERIE